MVHQKFGGDWTEDKLERLKKYLQAYITIFTSNPNAQYFTTIYIDSFAGSGEREIPVSSDESQITLDILSQNEIDKYHKGSTRIALEVMPSFNKYVFIEQNEKYVRSLNNLKNEFTDRNIEIVHGEANKELRNLCRQDIWKQHRAVLFLDPYGMNVEWTTLVAIADTKAIDLWILFPSGIGVNRNSYNQKIPPIGMQNRFTRIYGTDEWKSVFYPHNTNENLFGESETSVKQATHENIVDFFISRLKTIFAQTATNTKILYNSKNTPLYTLCFAAGNPKGAPTAVKIADYILKD